MQSVSRQFVLLLFITCISTVVAFTLNILLFHRRLPVNKGGLNSVNKKEAFENLGLGALSTHDVVPIELGGTGASSSRLLKDTITLGDVSVHDVVPVTAGGLGSKTIDGIKEVLELDENAYKSISDFKYDEISVHNDDATVWTYGTTMDISTETTLWSITKTIPINKLGRFLVSFHIAMDSPPGNIIVRFYSGALVKKYIYKSILSGGVLIFILWDEVGDGVSKEFKVTGISTDTINMYSGSFMPFYNSRFMITEIPDTFVAPEVYAGP